MKPKENGKPIYEKKTKGYAEKIGKGKKKGKKMQSHAPQTLKLIKDVIKKKEWRYFSPFFFFLLSSVRLTRNDSL